MARSFSLTVTSEAVGLDLVARFADEPAEGPMRTPRAQMVADAITSLTMLDPAIEVDYRPITPIDPISMKPDFGLTEHKTVITTGASQENVFDTFMISEAAMLDVAGRNYA